jgi:chitinase
MDAMYAYYLSRTFIPPSKPEAFAYFGMSLTAYLGLYIEGNARYQAMTGRKKIIDTFAYPGLAVKGITAIKPTLDVYSEVSLFYHLQLAAFHLLRGLTCPGI